MCRAARFPASSREGTVPRGTSSTRVTGGVEPVASRNLLRRAGWLRKGLLIQPHIPYDALSDSSGPRSPAENELQTRWQTV